VLAPDDVGVASRDPALAGLAFVLDPEAVRARVNAAGGLRVLDARARYVRYKPATSCVVGYELSTEAGLVSAFAKAHRVGDGVKLRKANEKSKPSGLEGWSLIEVPEACAYIADPANDRDLPALARLHCEGQRTTLLRKLLPDRRELWSAVPRTLRYKPERRWVGVIAAGGEPAVLLKAYRPEALQRARLGQRKLGTRFSRPLGSSTRLAILASTWVWGEPLSEVISTDRVDDLRGVGEALHSIHSVRPGSRTHLAVIAHDDGLTAAAEAVAVLAPTLADNARRAAAVISDQLSRQGSSFAVVHGDFSADQIIVTNGGLVVVDFDNAGLGDPAMDLASFAADLEVSQIEQRLAPERVAAVMSEVVAGYVASGGAVDPDRLRVNQAAALLRLVVKPFRERRHGWHETMGRILSRVDTHTHARDDRCR
jgi:phosphotransferase family enzyme